MYKNVLLGLALSLTVVIFGSCRSHKELSVTYVPEEQGITFEKITDELTDDVVHPSIYREDGIIHWTQLNTIALSPDNKSVAFISSKNDRSNIFVKSSEARGASMQRSYNSEVNSISYSPDGESICYSEEGVDGYRSIKIINAKQGSMVQQISPNYVYDFNPKYSPNGKRIFFERLEGSNYSIWSYSFETGSFSSHCYGKCPVPISDEEFLCTRKNSKGYWEIWRINFVKGSESVIASLSDRSFTSPSLSPDGNWMVCVSTTKPSKRLFVQRNLDLYIMRMDGLSTPSQLTFYKGTDYQPVWSPDGKFIYFMSQRGSRNGRIGKRKKS